MYPVPRPGHFRRPLCLTLAAFSLLLSLAAGAQQNADTGRELVHLLDYVSVEYPQWVKEGRVVNPAEYQEQVEFSQRARAMVAGLPANAARERLARAADVLAQQVANKADATAVAAAARALQGGLIEAYAISVAPRAVPDLSQAGTLYEAQCGGCHGAAGNGAGPLAATLSPKPANFQDPTRQASRSVFSLYNTITLGVSGTAMAGFPALATEQRWQLAFYVSGFSADDAQRAFGERAWKSGQGQSLVPDLAALTTLTPAQAAARGAAGADVLAYLRRNPGELAAQGNSPLAFSRATLEASHSAWQAGNMEQAYRLSVDAYLEGFELVEKSLDSVDHGLRTRAEEAMMSYRAAVKAGASASLVEPAYQSALGQLAEAQARLSTGQASPTTNFLSSLLIVLREGLEAILVLAAMAAYLVRTNRRAGLVWLHAGWIVALLLGGATWAVSSALLRISGAQREVTEGVTALLSSGVLLYVGFWLHNKSSTDKWNAFIRQKMSGAAKGNAWFGVGLVSFLAVYREVFETVLFYQTLWTQSEGVGRLAVLGGLGCGLASLVLVALLVIRSSVRLPLNVFFGVSSALLALMAVVFAGQGVAALQAAGRLPVAPLASMPSIPMLGVYPNLQSVSLQALVLLVILGGYWLTRPQPRT